MANHPASVPSIFNRGIRTVMAGVLSALGTGCTSLMIQQQGKPDTHHYKDCPVYYSMTRLELASIEWAFSDSTRPPDSCLAHYYPKAARDPLYQSSAQYMTPLFLLSLPVDAVVDTVTLPFAALSD